MITENQIIEVKIVDMRSRKNSAIFISIMFVSAQVSVISHFGDEPYIQSVSLR